MAVQDIQIGVGYLFGIAGSITITPASGSDLATKMNLRSRSKTHNWTDEELSSQDGTIIEACIASKEYKDLRIEFLPKGPSASTGKADAETSIDTFITAMTANKPFTIAASTVSSMDGDYNYKGGMEASETAEGKVMISFNARQYKKADGTFGSLALIAG